RLSAAMYEVLNSYELLRPWAHNPAIKSFLLTPPLRAVNALTVATTRTLIAVGLRILIQLALPLLVIFTAMAGWWVAALSILPALLIIAPDLILTGLRMLSEDRGVYAESTKDAPAAHQVVFPEQPTPRTPSAPASTTSTAAAPAPAPASSPADD